MKSERLGKFVFFGLAGVFALFIAYVSWMPVRSEDYFPNRSFFQGLQRLPYLFFPHLFRDVATNILLYIPLGALVASAVAPGRPRLLGRWLLVGFLVTVIMEIGQSLFDRYPDALDIITNSIGYAAGYCAVIAAVRLYRFNPIALTGFAVDEDQDLRVQLVAVSRFIYICVYVLVAMLPFDVSVIYNEIYAQLFPDAAGHTRLILDPLYHVHLWPQGAIRLGLELLMLLPVAVLTAWLNFIKGRRDVVYAVFPCVLVAMFCETSQVFVLSRTSDVAMFPIALAAGLLGWAVVKVWFSVRGINITVAPRGGLPVWRSWAVAVIAYVLAVSLLSLLPFDFERDHRGVALKIFSERNLVPFRYTTSALDVVRTAFLFVPLGFLVFYLLRAISPVSSGRKAIVLSGVVCAGFSTLMEVSQTIAVGRYADATDIVLALVGGTCGAVLARILHARTARRT
jgi:glycopeptide antibiotics resistance protein